MVMVSGRDGEGRLELDEGDRRRVGQLDIDETLISAESMMAPMVRVRSNEERVTSNRTGLVPSSIPFSSKSLRLLEQEMCPAEKDFT
ncbi:unnamed protein product [Merluccius merluccius]